VVVPSQADTIIFNDFGPSNGLGQGGWVVSGSQNTNLWAGETVQTADSFTSGINASLSHIDVALQLSTGANAFLVTLNQDSNGTPGLLLQQWKITNVAPFGNGSPSFDGFETLTPASATLLQSGSTYWVVVSSLDPSSTTDGAWHDSPTDIGSTDQQINGGGWQAFGGYMPAFSVDVTPVPEPSPIPLLGTAIVGLWAGGNFLKIRVNVGKAITRRR
jgi:hypothetical protein